MRRCKRSVTPFLSFFLSFPTCRVDFVSGVNKESQLINRGRLQILQEIGQKKAFAEQQLLIVKQQKVSNTRESRLIQLTESEVDSLPRDTKVYEGVGKMCVCSF